MWADRKNQEFRQWFRPKLHGSGLEIEITDTFPEHATADDVVLVMGKDRLTELQQRGHAHKGRAVGSQRGTVLGHGIRALVTWDCYLTQIAAERKPEIEWDLKLAMRLHETDTIDPVMGTYTKVDDFSEIEVALDLALEGDEPKIPIACDLETLGTDYINPNAWIVAISMTMEAGASGVAYFKQGEVPWDLVDQIKTILNHPKAKVYGANFKFDMLWMCEKWKIETFDAFTMDTTLVGSLVDENRSNSLNLHAKVYSSIGGYDDPFNAKYDKSRMDLVPVPDLVQYAGGDTDAGWQVGQKLRVPLSRNKRLLRFYKKLLHPAQNAVRKMEQRGMVVDVEEYNRLEDECEQVMEQCEERMRGELPDYIRRRWRGRLRDKPVYNANVIGDWMFNDRRGLKLKPKMKSPKTKKPSMAAEHFEMFANHPKAGQFIEDYLLYKKTEKTLSTYIVGFKKHLRDDGRFHPSYMLFRGKFHGSDSKDDDSGGRTGRTSVKEPAYQTIPKHTDWAKPLRRVYVPPPGHVVMNVDYSQGELRITACIADEPTMIQTYLDGIDLHLKTGAQLNSIELAEAIKMKASKDKHTQALIAKIRQGGKAGNFGLIYGMGAKGFKEYALKSYGVELTEGEAHGFRNDFFDLYDGLHPWHDDVKKFAHKHKYIESPLGRIRRVPLIDSFAEGIRAKQERQAINAGVQSTLTDLGLLAMAELDRRYPDLWQFGFTHDAISFYIPEDQVEQWAYRIREVMENLPLNEFNWHPQLSFPVDIEYGIDNLADLTELELAA